MEFLLAFPFIASLPLAKVVHGLLSPTGTAKPRKFTFIHLLSGISQRWLAYLSLSNDHCRKTLICAINRVLFVSLSRQERVIFGLRLLIM